MAFLSQNRRHHVMSPAAQDIAAKALAHLADAKNIVNALSATAASTAVDDLHTGRVALASSAALGFRPVGFDLYALSTEDPLLPTVWKKDTVIDPVTGKRTEWLVAYTTDDDDIVRSTAAGLTSVAWETRNVNVPQQKVHGGDRVQDPQTGRQGTVTQLTWADTHRGGTGHFELYVQWDGESRESLSDYNAVQPLVAQATQKTADISAGHGAPRFKQKVHEESGDYEGNYNPMDYDSDTIKGRDYLAFKQKHPEYQDYYAFIQMHPGMMNQMFGFVEGHTWKIPAGSAGNKEQTTDWAFDQFFKSFKQKALNGKPAPAGTEKTPAAWASQKTASMSPVLHTAADPTPKKNTPPIAPGILTKNLTLDQSGQGGTAKVTVDFNDPQKGEEFFKQVEDLAGGVGGGEAAPAEKPAEAPAEGPPPEGAPEGGPPAGGGASQKPPMPTPVPAAAPMASTIKNLTHFGSKIVYLTMEKYAEFSPVYSYVNEDGQRVEIDLPGSPKIGSTIRRPDTGENIRVGGVSVVEAAADDDEILSHLLATAVDISDQVPPMGWTNKESQNEEGEGGQKPLPPNPALQQGAPPTADTAAPPLYDSQTAPNAGGDKQKFNMSVNPADNSVTVKFEKADALQAIDNAVQGVQPPMGGPQAPPVPPSQGSPAGQAPPLTGQPKENFNDQASPTQF